MIPSGIVRDLFFPILSYLRDECIIFQSLRFWWEHDQVVEYFLYVIFLCFIVLKKLIKKLFCIFWSFDRNNLLLIQILVISITGSVFH